MIKNLDFNQVLIKIKINLKPYFMQELVYLKKKVFVIQKDVHLTSCVQAHAFITLRKCK